MKIHRIQIRNFRNFKKLDVMLGEQVVIVGENKIGKTNLLHALRLVLDPSLPDSARQLQKTDFWDGLGDSLTREHSIEISVELTDFEDDEDLMAVLAEHLIEPEPMVSRLTYTFQPQPTLEGDPQSDADYEFFMYGGGREDNRAGYEVRSRIPLDVLHALRDAERDLATWTRSPLKPLLDEAVKDIDRDELKMIADDVLEATQAVLDVPKAKKASESEEDAEMEPGESEAQDEEGEDELDKTPIRKLAYQIASRLEDMVGVSQALDTTLGFSPTDPDRLLRALRLFIDDGRRSVSEASLGSANLLYLTLKSIGLDQLAELGLRDHTFLAIEEPEAHLHPHLQRLVYRDFLRRRPHQEAGAEEETVPRRHQTVLLTTHSPHIVSVAPLRSIVLLKYSSDNSHTEGASAARIELTDKEVEDIERYLDVNRGELLFARGVILVEGPAEEYLIPVFGELLGYEFDELGISVCSVSGTNFLPYVRLLGKEGFRIPFAVLTDLDPKDDGKSLGGPRVLRLLGALMEPEEYEALSDDERLERAPQRGIFLNNHTLEIDLFKSGCHESMCNTLIELTENNAARERAQDWHAEPDSLDKEQFLEDIRAIGKGRFAQRLASYIETGGSPPYIEEAIRYVAARCG